MRRYYIHTYIHTLIPTYIGTKLMYGSLEEGGGLGKMRLDVKLRVYGLGLPSFPGPEIEIEIEKDQVKMRSTYTPTTYVHAAAERSELLRCIQQRPTPTSTPTYRPPSYYVPTLLPIR